jgi:hypothetical protein
MTDTPTRSPQPPDLTRRTLTPFGYAVCVVVPLLIAAVGFTYLHFHYDKEQLVRGSHLRILTSDWKAGDPPGSSSVTGQLMLEDDSCLRLQTPDGAQVDVVWPFDYEAAVEDSQSGPRVSVYDTDREVVARNSDVHLQLQGSFAAADAYAGQPCAPASGQVFLVQATPSLVSG